MNPYKMMVLPVCMCALETPECSRRTPVCVSTRGCMCMYSVCVQYVSVECARYSP